VLIEELGVKPPSEYRPDEWGVVNCFAHREILMRLLESREDAESLTDLGNMLYARGRIDEAIEKWKSAQEGYQPRRNLAIAFWHKKDDLLAAYTYMREAADLCPANPAILRDLDILADLSGNEEDRLGIVERIMTHAPDDSGCLERAVRAYLAADRLDEAVDLLQTRTFFVAELAYQTRILYVWAMIRRGVLRMSKKRYVDAAADFRAATEYPANLGASRMHDSSDAQAFYFLGEALSRTGDTGGAREAYASAADDIPIRGTAQAFYVGKARARLGRDDAQEAFAKILPASESADTPEGEARLNMLRFLERIAAHDTDSAGKYDRLAKEYERANPAKMRRYMESLAYARSEGRRVPIAVW
jgi:tetratricopeptide (TPR) repeat protein